MKRLCSLGLPSRAKNEATAEAATRAAWAARTARAAWAEGGEGPSGLSNSVLVDWLFTKTKHFPARQNIGHLQVWVEMIGKSFSRGRWRVLTHQDWKKFIPSFVDSYSKNYVKKSRESQRRIASFVDLALSSWSKGRWYTDVVEVVQGFYLRVNVPCRPSSWVLSAWVHSSTGTGQTSSTKPT